MAKNEEKVIEKNVIDHAKELYEALQKVLISAGQRVGKDEKTAALKAINRYELGR